MAVQNQDETLSSGNTGLDKNFLNEKLQQIDSPYFLVEKFHNHIRTIK